MNIRLCLSFDGTAYHGWQRQLNAVTVQQKLEEAIERITGTASAVTGCSRTDAGVHARAYTCNFFSETRIPMEKLPLALNTALPRDIRVQAAAAADEAFHSRFSAASKTYQYYFWNRTVADPFLSRYTYHFPQPLTLELMRLGAGHFVGTHDFSAVMAAGGSQKTTVRTVNFLTLEEAGGKISMEINADAYLYNMVRIIAGTLAYIGCGKLEAGQVPLLLRSGRRVDAGITAPPQGLFLKEVFYRKTDG